MSELLPKPVRILLGAAGRDVSDRALRRAAAGKVVLITGASSGIGAATALRLGRAGATVLLVARSVDALATIQAEVEAVGGRAHVHPCDLRDGAQVDALVADVLDRYGRVDVLVNNAGLSIRRWISDSYDRFHDIQRTADVNYLGPARLVLALLPSMRARRSGHIVNVSTTGANLPGLHWSAYVASKTAFDSWLRSVAPEARADGVHTTTIYMMLVRSPMLGNFWFWRYLPGMSTEEAAGMVARAIAERPRVMWPWWARLTAPAALAAQEPVDAALTLYAQLANPASRPRGVSGAAIAAAETGGRAVNNVVGSALTILGTGAVRPVRPDRPVRALLARRRFGTSPALAGAVGTALYGGRTALADERGALTHEELDANAAALAAALHHETGLGPGRRLGIMCRNHRGFVEAALAGARLGADLVPLNTDFAGPQLGAVLAREAIDVAIHDAEFAAAFDATDFDGARVTAWHDGDPMPDTLDELIARGTRLPAPPDPPRPGRIVMLTSGSTGTPKGAPRDFTAGRVSPATVTGAIATLARLRPVPHAGDPVLVAPPLYHMYGFAAAFVALAAGSPIVLQRRFDAEQALAAIQDHHVGVLLAVPTMLKRIMDLPEDVRSRYDTASLRMVPCGAAPLPPQLAADFMDAFGDVLFNGYGSTEVGAVSLAMPADLRAAPGTVGRAAPGVTVKILDDSGRPVPAGARGRIFVGSAMLFEGYSGGGSKEMHGNLMSIGDVGHMDAAGRLFIDGRDDEMIVSGGENVFPQEVEELLITHEAVADAGAVGVADEDFGQRLVAFVVLKGETTEDELKSYVRAHLARFKVPRTITFVDQLPRTSSGKIRRNRLRELASA